MRGFIVNDGIGLFAEGRYFHVFGAYSESDDLILASGGLAAHF